MTVHNSSQLKGGFTFFPSHMSSGLEWKNLALAIKKICLSFCCPTVCCCCWFLCDLDPGDRPWKPSSPSQLHMLCHWTPQCPSGLLITLHFHCHCPWIRHHHSLPSLFHMCLLCSVPAVPIRLFSAKNWFEALVGTCFLSRYMPSLCSSYHTSQISGWSGSSLWPLLHTGSSC